MRTAPAATISRSIVPGNETLTARPRWTSDTCAAVKRKCDRRSVSMEDTPPIPATCAATTMTAVVAVSLIDMFCGNATSGP